MVTFNDKELSRVGYFSGWINKRLDSNIEWKSWIIHLSKIIEILNKFKIFKFHRIGKSINIIDLKKQDFLSAEKISERSCFVNIKFKYHWIAKYIHYSGLAMCMPNE